jgi:hypothetical protein
MKIADLDRKSFTFSTGSGSFHSRRSIRRVDYFERFVTLTPGTSADQILDFRVVSRQVQIRAIGLRFTCLPLNTKMPHSATDRVGLCV